MSKNPHIGSSLDDFLKEEGLYEDATNHAVKRMLAMEGGKGHARAGHNQGRDGPAHGNVSALI